MSFKASRFEYDLIAAIAERAVAKAREFGIDYRKMDAVMDLTACHANGCELALDLLLNADDGTFGHDVFGIRRHIDRRTGKLGGCFVPRTAQCYHERRSTLREPN